VGKYQLRKSVGSLKKGAIFEYRQGVFVSDGTSFDFSLVVENTAYFKKIK